MDSPAATADRKPCFAIRLCAEVKRLAVLAVLLGLVVVAGKYYGFDRLNDEIRVRVESQLREHYQGLSVSVKSARRIAGQGVEIRGVRIAEAGGKDAPVLAEIDEIFAQCDTRLPDFLTKPPQVTAIRVQRLKLRAERKSSGRWNLSHLLPLPPCQSATAPVATISDAALEIIDPTQPSAGGMMLRNIELTVQPQSDGETSGKLLQIRGTLAGDHVQHVEIDALLDPVTSGWEIRGAVEGLEFSPRLRAALPRELSAALAPLSSIRGRTYFGFHATRAAQSASVPEAPPPLQFVAHGKISEGRIDDARLPEPLTDVEATIRCDNHGVLIDELSARCGPTQLELKATAQGYDTAAIVDLELTARYVQLERLPIATLTTAVRDTWRLFQPRGLADVRGRLHFDGRQWQPDLTIHCHDLSLTYARFPYRLTDGVGIIAVKPDSASVQMRTVGGGRFIDCKAEVANPGPAFTGWIELHSEGSVVIDEKLLAAMDPSTQSLVRAFHPRGSASFVVRFQRQPGESAIHRHLQIYLDDCSLQHERFPYPIDHVCGALEQQGDNWRFQGLTGRNDSAEISGEGSWLAPDRGANQLSLVFNARDVPLAEELRQALPAATQRLWSNLRPRGNIDRLQILLRYDAARKGADSPWSIDVRAEKLPLAGGGERGPLSLEPIWFRYALNDVTGSLVYHDGRMELANLRAEHNRATISADGHCTMLQGGASRLELTKLAADHVEIDQELLAALPGGLGSSLGRFPLEGPLNVIGALTIVVPPEPDAQPHLAWNLQLDVEHGRLLTAIPVEHVHGGVTLTGRQSAEGLVAQGELKVDSAMIRGIQFTSIQGPYWIDGRRLVLGALADRSVESRTLRQVTTRVLGGLLSLDGDVSLVGEGTFQLQATLANADLAEIARQLAPHQQIPTGKVFAVVQMAGNGQGKHTWKGNGQISLREADLYELPAMIRLLKVLSIQRPNTTAFTNSNIDFRIEGDDLAFDRVDFSGDAISLKGKGRMNGQRQIDLKFYPLVGREERQLAIFRPLLGQTGQEFMLIEVSGTIDQPQIDRRVFPRLDDQLAQLFPELGRDEGAMPKAPLLGAPREAWNRVWPFQRR